VNLALFMIGRFIETSASIIVLAPMLVPVAVRFGVSCSLSAQWRTSRWNRW
jgi:TRAP-type C4-dicarboxylate transport system permease large subunit